MAEEKSIFQKIGDAIADYAPTLAGVLTATGVGAPIGAAVGAAGVLARTFGLGGDAKPEDVLKAITSDPEIALKARMADQAYSLELRKQEIEELKARLADVQSARGRQIESEKLTGKRDINLYALAWLIVGGFFLLTGGLLYFSYQGKPIVDSSGVLFMLLGTLATGFGMVLQYFFGSSKGSADKSQELASIAAKKG